MFSPWYIPLPIKDYTPKRVVVYCYSGKWIPIMFCHLRDAIALHRKARETQKDILVFPLDLDPADFQSCLG